MRGYFGVAIYRPKNSTNIGTLFRTANILGAKFMATVGPRYQHQPGDTLHTPRHIPLFEYTTFDAFKSNLPKDSQLVAVELVPNACLLEAFKHPQRAIYLLGAEDDGLPKDIINQCDHVIALRGDRSMNVSVAGSIVLYDKTRQFYHTKL